jgi:hypothetical protein
LNDAQIAEATAMAAMKIVLERSASEKNNRITNVGTEAFTTVHLLTMANSYISAQKE